VFEFGSGHSTLYWAELGAEVCSVEDHPGWFELVQQHITAFPQNRVFLEQEQAGYLARIDSIGGLFDMVLVDGSHRKECLEPAIRHLKPGGLLVVDNTDWHWFDDVDDLLPRNWKRKTCAGWAPFIGHRSETSIWRSSSDADLRNRSGRC
jgi:predicted O-methyltransferase YrrM